MMESPDVAIGSPPTSEDAPPVHIYNLIIPNRSGDHVLATILPTQILQLPRIRDNQVHGVETHVKSELGIHVHLVRDVLENVAYPGGANITFGDTGEETNDIYVFDMLDDHLGLRGKLQWIPRHMALSKEWVQLIKGFSVVNFIEQVFEEKNGERQWKEAQPWLSAGWFTKISVWVNGVLEARNMILEAPILELHGCGFAMVLKGTVKTKKCDGVRHVETSEVVYTKTSFPALREGQRTAAIERVIGGIAPEILGVHEGDGTILMRDAGTISDEVLDEETLLKTIVQMQQLSMNRIEELEAEGLAVMDSEWIVNNVEWILYHEAVDELWRYEEVSEDDLNRECIESLREKVGVIKDVCRKVTKYGLPRTLVHGDLGLHNVGSRKKGVGGMYCLFDWGKSFVGNPVYDFQNIQSDRSFRRMSSNKENVILQFRKHWMPSVSREDVKLLFKMTSVMLYTIEMYDVIRLYEAYGSWESIDSYMLTSLEDIVMLLESSLYEFT